MQRSDDTGQAAFQVSQDLGTATEELGPRRSSGRSCGNLQTGDRITIYDHDSKCWFQDGVVGEICNKSKKVAITYDAGRRRSLVDFYLLPYRTYTNLHTLERCGPKIRDNVIEMLRLKAQGRKTPHELFMQTHDMIFTMCIQREPFNFSRELYQLSQQFPQMIYRFSAKPLTVSDFRDWLSNTPSPEVLAATIDNCFNYLNRYYIRNELVLDEAGNEVPLDSVKESILKTCSGTGDRMLKTPTGDCFWSDTAARIVQVCDPDTLRDEPTMCLEVITRMQSFLPPPEASGSIAGAHAELARVKRKIFTNAIHVGMCDYGRPRGMMIPVGVSQVIAEFTL